jgi:hypothetical protein
MVRLRHLRLQRLFSVAVAIDWFVALVLSVLVYWDNSDDCRN